MPSGRDTNQNRLIKETPKAFEEGNVELHFVYDYHGRRISKERRTYNPASMKFEFEKRIEYIFDGWNVILEKATEGSPATAASAGGVGGLLATFATKSSPATAGTETHYYHYDANGNVTETVDSNGDLTASYEYGPFGELVSETGSYVDENTYKFSTKPQDTETGYYYYGFRYYGPDNGRWLNIDPIGEKGGMNLYQMVFNDSINWVDLFGLQGASNHAGKCPNKLEVTDEMLDELIDKTVEGAVIGAGLSAGGEAYAYIKKAKNIAPGAIVYSAAAGAAYNAAVTVGQWGGGSTSRAGNPRN